MINVAAYDYHYPYDPAVNHHAPLFPLPEEVEKNLNTNLNVVSYLPPSNKFTFLILYSEFIDVNSDILPALMI